MEDQTISGVPMKISIVTPSLNQGEFIEQNIRSVLQQDYHDVEHIIVDGGSTDATLSTLAKYPHLSWTSERDSGQSNAINKGFQRSKGEIVAYLNSDDFYEENVFGAVSEYFLLHPECKVLYGDITYINRSGKPINTLTGDVITYQSLTRCPDLVRQPSSFWKREILEECGTMDERLQVVMDFDFFLRIAKRYKFHYLRRNLSYFRTYEENKTSRQSRTQIVEIYHVLRKQGVKLEPRHLWYFAAKVVKSVGAVRKLRGVLGQLKRRFNAQ